MKTEVYPYSGILMSSTDFFQTPCFEIIANSQEVANVHRRYSVPFT